MCIYKTAQYLQYIILQSSSETAHSGLSESKNHDLLSAFDSTYRTNRIKKNVNTFETFAI